MPITLDNLHQSLKQDVLLFRNGDTILASSKILGIMPYKANIVDLEFITTSISGNPQVNLVSQSSTQFTLATSIVANTVLNMSVSTASAFQKGDRLILVQSVANAALDNVCVKLVVERTEDLEVLT